ncbi:MAG: VCBS repeat-containing protein, partial [Bacteroidales bacterium]|nr:VCBS repeat-containing protein [Bacteroidales bacterium]
MKALQILLILIALSFTTKAQTFEDINASLPGLTFSVSSFGDFDGDGDLDLYLSGYDDSYTVSGGVYVYDNGTYTLSATANVPPVYMGSADWGDIDGDNDLDIVILGQDPSYTDTTEVFRNNGDGTFTNLSAGLPSAEQGEVRFADIDGDNDLDITLTGIGAADRITKFFTNDGAGNFTEMTSLNLPGMNMGRIKWADYDNDADLDFVLSGFDDGTGGSNTFYSEIYTNNGNGTFSVSGISLHQGWLGDSEWGDYNGDGNIDLIISGAGGDGSERFTLLYKNNGDGTFTELDPGFPGVSHSSIEWADFDGDGDLDVFIVGETTTP